MRSRFNPDGETPRDNPIRVALACCRHGRRFIRITRLYAFGTLCLLPPPAFDCVTPRSRVVFCIGFENDAALTLHRRLVSHANLC